MSTNIGEEKCVPIVTDRKTRGVVGFVESMDGFLITHDYLCIVVILLPCTCAELFPPFIFLCNEQ